MKERIGVNTWTQLGILNADWLDGWFDKPHENEKSERRKKLEGKEENGRVNSERRRKEQRKSRSMDVNVDR